MLILSVTKHCGGKFASTPYLQQPFFPPPVPLPITLLWLALVYCVSSSVSCDIAEMQKHLYESAFQCWNAPWYSRFCLQKFPTHPFPRRMGYQLGTDHSLLPDITEGSYDLVGREASVAQSPEKEEWPDQVPLWEEQPWRSSEYSKEKWKSRISEVGLLLCLLYWRRREKSMRQTATSQKANPRYIRKVPTSQSTHVQHSVALRSKIVLEPASFSCPLPGRKGSLSQ